MDLELKSSEDNNVHVSIKYNISSGKTPTESQGSKSVNNLFLNPRRGQYPLGQFWSPTQLKKGSKL